MVDGRISVIDPSPTGDEILDHALEEIRSARKPRGAQHWVRKLGGRSPRDQVTDQLLARGVLRRQDDKVLWIFPYTRYLAEDSAPELELRTRLRDAVLNGRTPDARSAALLSLIKSCNLADDVFGSADRRRVRKRLDEISGEELIDDAVSDTVAAAQAATQAAMSASVIAATTSATASCSTSTTSSC